LVKIAPRGIDFTERIRDFDNSVHAIFQLREQTLDLSAPSAQEDLLNVRIRHR
jgi:hypothetical protein